MGFMKPLRLLCAVLAALLLSACAQGTAAPESPAQKPEDITAIFAGEQAASAPCDPKGMYLQEVLYE